MNVLDYCSSYFIKTKKILYKKNRDVKSILQIYSLSSDNYYLFGIQYILKIIKDYCKKQFYTGIIINYIDDFQLCQKFAPVIQIECEYWKICELENIILGTLAQFSSVYTSARKLTKITNKPIIYMGDRQNFYINQKYDAFCAYNAGVKIFTTKKEVELFKDKSDYKIVGTMPHGLINVYNNNLVKLSSDFLDVYPNESLICLVDFSNDVVTESLKVAKVFKEKLFAVRVDTSPVLKDKSFSKKDNDKLFYGSNVKLIKLLRKTLNENGFDYVKIIVSSNVDEKRIKSFIKNNCQPDYYGVGSYFLNSNKINFSCDIVKRNGVDYSKFGRKFQNYNYSNKIII